METFTLLTDAMHGANRQKREPAKFLTTVGRRRDGTPLSGDL